jgi:small GTP-binding protein
MMIRRKLVAVGDLSGKTCVLLTYLKDEFPEPQLTFLSWDITDVEVEGQVVEVHVWDTCSKERFKDARISCYKGADVFVIFFSIYSRTTFENVAKLWIPEIKKYGSRDTAVLLVGTHCEMIQDGSNVTNDEGRAMAKEINAVDYIECKADTKFNVDEVFVTAIKATLTDKTKKIAINKRGK